MCTTYSLLGLCAGISLAFAAVGADFISTTITAEASGTGIFPLPSWMSAALSGVNEIPGMEISWETSQSPATTPTVGYTALPSNWSGPATTATALPAATYRATLPGTNFAKGFATPLTGNITIFTSDSEPGVQVSANFFGFPSIHDYGPFIYHIHAAPVPEDGNCTAALKHLDPANRGEKPPCSGADPASCQVGDLSGKYGNITDTEFNASYGDLFLSTDLESPAFFGDKSVVIHTNNATRIACANFVKVEDEGEGEGGDEQPEGDPGSEGGQPPKEGPEGEDLNAESTPAVSTGNGPAETGTSDSTGEPTGSGLPVQSTGEAAAVSLGGLAVAAGLFAMAL